MAHAVQAETEAVNADSFLDIVASVVSIMIIMVLMTGLKIKHTPVEAPAAEVAQVKSELTKELAGEQTVQLDVLKVASEIETLQRETALRKRDRDMLAMAVTSLEQRVQGTSQQATAPSQADLDLAGQLSEAKQRLEQLDHQRAAVESAPAPSVQIECYPTPISRTVDGHEIHFQLRAGRLAHIPLEALLARFKTDAHNKVYKLADSAELTDTIGPEGGFRLRYTLARHETSAEEARETGRAGVFVQLKRWTLIPVADDLGETLDEALADGSQFRLAVSERSARGAAVTLWTYPDSFDAFRRIKKELYRLGFVVAARPLPEGTPISGSPEGSKSTAQ